MDPITGQCTPLKDYGMSLYMGGKCDDKERIVVRLKPADLVHLASLLDGSLEAAKGPVGTGPRLGDTITGKPTG